MSNNILIFDQPVDSAMECSCEPCHRIAMKAAHAQESATFLQETMRSVRSLWALSTATRLMMAQEQCQRAVRHVPEGTGKALALQARSTHRGDCDLPSGPKSVKPVSPPAQGALPADPQPSGNTS